MALELTFVNQSGDSAPKRRRLAKACESCRARKKRCIHFASSKNTESNKTDSVEGNGESSVNGGPSIGVLHANQSRAQPRRFVSDLTAESTFLQRSPPVAQDDERQPNGDIGIWVDKREWDSLLRQKNSTGDAIDHSASSRNQRPHSAALAPLIDIYFHKIHPILPLLDEAEFRKSHAGGIVPEPLAHALCLVAAKDAAAAPYLRLNESTDPLPPREFCSRLHESIMGALRAPCRFEKITLIRILALTSLHVEGQDGAEEASMCLNQAMHYTQTFGWHLGQQSGVASGDDLTTKRLFWCLWSLDRINGCMYGRPVMMSDIDIAIEHFAPGESHFPAFEVWLYISRMLNRIISFYRPGNSFAVTGWEDNFPSFEEAVDECKAWNEPHSVLATLHLFFLLTAVLSHRSRGAKYMPRSTPSYVRQSLCSLELHRMMNSDLFTALHPLPVLPYAISLALSVSYQHLRQAQLIHQQEDARDDFRTCYEVLQRLKCTWSSADVIAAIAKKVLDQLNKATDLSTFRIGRYYEGGRVSPGICTASLTKPHTLIDRGADENGAEHSVGAETTTPSWPQAPNTPANQDWFGLFEGMDDIFGTYLDPNYPVNLDDFSFIENPSPVEGNPIQT